MPNGPRCPLAQPCADLPGTPEKVETMRGRVALKKHPSHPDDPTVDDCQRMGLVLIEASANGATAWQDDGDPQRRAGATTAHGTADEIEVHAEEDEEDAAALLEEVATWEEGRLLHLDRRRLPAGWAARPTAWGEE